MHELVEQIEKEEGIKVDTFEVWHNKENEKKMEAISHFNECGGVPFFFNTKNNKWLCGEVSLEELKDWTKD